MVSHKSEISLFSSVCLETNMTHFGIIDFKTLKVNVKDDKSNSLCRFGYMPLLSGDSAYFRERLVIFFVNMSTTGLHFGSYMTHCVHIYPVIVIKNNHYYIHVVWSEIIHSGFAVMN